METSAIHRCTICFRFHPPTSSHHHLANITTVKACHEKICVWYASLFVVLSCASWCLVRISWWEIKCTNKWTEGDLDDLQVRQKRRDQNSLCKCQEESWTEIGIKIYDLRALGSFPFPFIADREWVEDPFFLCKQDHRFFLVLCSSSIVKTPFWVVCIPFL